MRRVTGLGTGLIMVASWSSASADEPPPLTPPVLNPSTADAAPAPAGPPPVTAAVPASGPAPTATPVPAPERAEPRPILVIPGVTTPRASARPPQAPASTPATVVPAGPESTLPPLTLPPLEATASGVPDLMAPMGALPADRNAGRSTNTQSRETGSSSSPPTELRLEHEDRVGPGAPGAPRSVSSPRNGTPRAVSPDPSAARRAPGLFGRVFPPVLGERSPNEPRGRVTVEPRTDPATDAALKRRLERQIRESLGNRVQSYEVRVVGREVIIRARTTRFWQRRSVRNTLESLPGLNGYRTTVVVDD